MSVLNFIKQGTWFFIAVLASTLTWFTNVLQKLRNFLLHVLDIPIAAAMPVAAGILSLFIGIYICTDEMFDGFFGALAFSVFIFVILSLGSALCCLVYSLVSQIVRTALIICNFDWLTTLFASLAEKSFSCYLKTTEHNFNHVLSSRAIYFVPFVLNAINKAAEKLSSVIYILVYVFFAAGGAYGSYLCFFGEDVSKYSSLDFAVTIALSVATIGAAIVFAFFVVAAMSKEDEYTRHWDFLFAEYARLFKVTADSKGNHSYRRDDGKESECDWTLQEDNPFITLLATATTADELRKMFREKARQLHPDAGGSEKDMQQLTAAYETLKKKNFQEI